MVAKRKTAGGMLEEPHNTPDPNEEDRLNKIVREIDFENFGGIKPDSIATELRMARDAKKYSFADLHRLTGLSRTALHQYESGARKPGARELILLCQALEVSPNRLLLGSENPFQKASGVLVPLAKLARSEPQKALAVGLLMIPMVSAILATIGDETLNGLATLADETLRARDPETYASLSALVDEMLAVKKQDIQGKSPDEMQSIAVGLFEKAGLPVPATAK